MKQMKGDALITFNQTESVIMAIRQFDNLDIIVKNNENLNEIENNRNIENESLLQLEAGNSIVSFFDCI